MRKVREKRRRRLRIGNTRNLACVGENSSRASPALLIRKLVLNDVDDGGVGTTSGVDINFSHASFAVSETPRYHRLQPPADSLQVPEVFSESRRGTHDIEGRWLLEALADGNGTIEETAFSKQQEFFIARHRRRRRMRATTRSILTHTRFSVSETPR